MTRAPKARLAVLLLGLAACATPSEPTRSPEVPPPAATSPVPAPPNKPYPPTAVQSVDDTYHGVTVADPYRWLEDGKDPKVAAWSDAQNVYARSVLDRLPQVAAVKARLTTLLGHPSPRYFSLVTRGKRSFAMLDQPPKQQPYLIVDEGGASRVLFDPNALDAKGTTAIDWFVPSFDGKLVAVSISKGGTESGDVHVIDVATGKVVHEVVPRAHGGTAGGSLSWDPDGKGFTYTRYPRAGERPAADMDFHVQVFHHTLGTPAPST